MSLKYDSNDLSFDIDEEDTSNEGQNMNSEYKHLQPLDLICASHPIAIDKKGSISQQYNTINSQIDQFYSK